MFGEPESFQCDFRHGGQRSLIMQPIYCMFVCVGVVFFFMHFIKQAYSICSWRSGVGNVLPLSVSYFLVLRYGLWPVAFSKGPFENMEDQQVAGCVAPGLDRLSLDSLISMC